MWRPVALSAFLALLFMSSRSGQEPVETNTNDTAKTDLGAQESSETPGNKTIKIDLARASAHPKTTAPARKAEAEAEPDTAEPDDGRVEVAHATLSGSRTIPLPAPKSSPGDSGTRLVVTQGEQKTALTSNEEALRLMPPGPDFAAKVQRELVRLGCYRGSVDNIWGPMSRNAVARFNRVAKANIPLKQPTRALLSSARKAPDGYCNGGSDQPKLASLESGGSIEALKNRPEYLPPWMRGEPMPEPDENTVETAEEPAESEASPDSGSATAQRKPRAKPSRTRRAEVRQRRPQRRQARRRTSRRGSSLNRQLRNSDFSWPGQ